MFRVIGAWGGWLVLLSALAGADDAEIDKGKAVFAARKCSMCHSIAGKGNPKGSLDGVGSKYKPDEIREWIVNAKQMTAKHKAERKPPMKDFSSLPKEDVDSLVAYLEALKK